MLMDGYPQPIKKVWGGLTGPVDSVMTYKDGKSTVLQHQYINNSIYDNNYNIILMIYFLRHINFSKVVDSIDMVSFI